MLATDLFLKPSSGFIAVSPGRADTAAERRSSNDNDTTTTTAPVASPEAAASVADWTGGVGQRPTWESPVGAGVRKVEAAIVASICAFFAFGLASTLGLF